jgi:hypothetical protein
VNNNYKKGLTAKELIVTLVITALALTLLVQAVRFTFNVYTKSRIEQEVGTLNNAISKYKSFGLPVDSWIADDRTKLNNIVIETLSNEAEVDGRRERFIVAGKFNPKEHSSVGQGMSFIFIKDKVIPAAPLIHGNKFEVTVGEPFQYDVSVTSYNNEKLTVEVPPWAKWDELKRQVTGTPNDLRDFEIKVTAVNDIGVSSKSIKVKTLVGEPKYTGKERLTFFAGIEFSTKLLTTNGPCEFSATGIPNGMTLSKDGTLSGNMEVWGEFPFKV